MKWLVLALVAVGSVALALILFDGGLKTRFNSIQTVIVPSAVLATIGVLLTAVIAAPSIDDNSTRQKLCQASRFGMLTAPLAWATANDLLR